MYSRQELNSDSNYILYVALVRAMRQVRPDWQFVIIFPDSKSSYKYEDDGFFSLSNVFRAPMRMSPRKMANVVHFNAPWWDQLFRRFGFDCVLCNQVETAAQVARAGQATIQDVGRPAAIAAHYYVIHKSLPYAWKQMEHVVWSQIMGAHTCDLNIFNSDYCKWMFFDAAKEYANDKILKDLRSRSSVIPMGTLDVSRLRYRENDNDVPVIVYNHRLQQYKQYLDTFDVLNELYQSGLKFRCIVTSSTAENTKRILTYPFVELKMCATREKYYETLREGDINVTNSVHETFCISAAESMALGQCLVAPKGLTFPQITNSEENGYPYLYTSRDEQLAFLRKLILDKDERRTWGRILSDHVRSQYNDLTWAERYAQAIETLLSRDSFKAGTPDDVRSFIAKRLRTNSGVSIREFWNIVGQVPVNGRRPFGSQSLPYIKLSRLVRELGGSVRIIDGVQRVFSE
jgi:glycosyltransferase involved in cell wall biosynthesis